MRNKTIFSMLIMLSCPFFVLCDCDCVQDQEYIAIEKSLKSLSNVVVKYKSEFDTRVKFFELQEAIDVIDESMLDYQGTAKAKLDQLRTLNSDARSTYHDCVGPVFEWCVSINSTFDIFIPYISDPSLTEHDKNIIWNMTLVALGDGREKTYNSIELLKLVQKKTTDLKNLLDSMLHDMHNDFGPNGFYGKHKQELMCSIAERDKPRQALAVAGVIGLIFRFIAAFVVGPIGVTLSLLTVFTRVGLGEVVQRQRPATFEEELKAIETFFNQLDEQINVASTIASQVNVDLEEDKNNLYALAGLITAADRNKRLLLMDSPTLRAQLVPSFRNLGNKCYEYSIWHGYGSKGYTQKHARARRQATETCEAQRLKAMKMITESIPQNTTSIDLLSKAHSIIKKIDCEPKTLPTLPQFEQPPALSLSDENAGATSNEETTKELTRLPNYISSKNMIVAYLKHVQ